MMSWIEVFKAGGLTLVPLALFSVLIWIVIFERALRFRKVGREMAHFHLDAMNAVLRGDLARLRAACEKNPEIPNAQIARVAMDRFQASDLKLQEKWLEALERERQRNNQDLRRNLWILGTIASSAPFVGLFGTVVGILRSFQDIAKSGVGGFGVVAAGISEALIATAAGIGVAVIASIAFNVFQTQWSKLVLALKHQTEEFAEILGQLSSSGERKT